MAGKAFEYGWCKTDHKDGRDINERWRTEDYVFGALHGRGVQDALVRLGLPMPDSEQVFRGTHHDLLFLNSHGVVVRIGPTDLDALTHPAILQPLGWADTKDPDVKVVLYPGIEHYLHAYPREQQAPLSCLKQFMRQTDQQTGDVNAHNVGVIRTQINKREQIVPVILDIDHKFNGVGQEIVTARFAGTDLSGYERRLPSRTIERMMEGVSSTQSFGQSLQEAFYVHQPLRHLFWSAYQNGDMPDAARLQNFWDRCQRALHRAERFIVHGWTQRRNQHGIDVWVKDEKLVENMALYRPWTKAAKDARLKRSGSMRLWDEYCVKIAQDRAFFNTLPEYLRRDASFVLQAVGENREIATFIATDLLNDPDFLERLGDLISVEKMLALAAPGLRADNRFMLSCVIKSSEAYPYCAESLKNDEDFVLRCMRENSSVVEHIGAQYLDDRKFVAHHIAHYPDLYTYAGQDVKRDPEIARIAIAKNSRNMDMLPARLLTDDVFVGRAMENCPALYQKIPEDMRMDEGLAMKAVRAKADLYKFIPKAVAHNEAFAIECLRLNIDTYIEMPRSLRENKNVVLECIAQAGLQNIYAIENIVIHDKNDDEIAWAIARHVPEMIREGFDQKLNAFQDDAFLIAALARGHLSLDHIPDDKRVSDDFIQKLKTIDMADKDGSFIIKLFGQHMHMAAVIGHSFLSDREFLLRNAQKMAPIYSSLPDGMRQDEDIALAMIVHRPAIYVSIPEHLANDTAFAKEAMAANVDCFFNMKDEMRERKELTIEMIEQSARQKRTGNLRSIHSRFRGDRDIAQAIIRYAPDMVRYLFLDFTYFERDGFLLDAVRGGYLAPRQVPRYKMESEEFVRALLEMPGIKETDIPRAKGEKDLEAIFAEKAQKAHAQREKAVARFQDRAFKI